MQAVECCVRIETNFNNSNKLTLSNGIIMISSIVVLEEVDP